MNTGDLIYPTCPICGNESNFKVKFEVEGLTVVECRDDGMMFFRPNVSKDVHSAFLDKDYWVAPAFQKAIASGKYDFDTYLSILESDVKVKGYPDYLEPEHLKAKTSWGRRIMQWFLRYAKDRSLKTVVEIGCATGHMLKGFFDMGNFEHGVGIDVSPLIIEDGKKLLKNYIDKGKLTLFTGECWDYNPSVRFDCIIMWDSFEHIQYPEKALKWLKENSSPEALMVIHTPDAEFAESPNWYYWSPKQHCFFYTQDTLDMLFEKFGFYRIAEKISPEPDEMVLIYKKN